jgi:hypothetical protein
MRVLINQITPGLSAHIADAQGRPLCNTRLKLTGGAWEIGKHSDYRVSFVSAHTGKGGCCVLRQAPARHNALDCSRGVGKGDGTR